MHPFVQGSSYVWHPLCTQKLSHVLSRVDLPEAYQDCSLQKQPADTQKKSERNVSKSPSGRLSSSLSPGRLAAARRLEAAAAKVHKEQTESNGGPNSNSRVVVPSSPPSPGISVGRDEKPKSSSKKFSLRELRNSSSGMQDSPINPTSEKEVDFRTVEEVRLDHLSSMLASGQLQDSWGAGYSELSCHLFAAWHLLQT